MAKAEKWSKTVDVGKARIHVVERSPGRISLRWWDPNRGNWRWRSLKHGDRDRAEDEANLLAAELLGLPIQIQKTLKLGDLLDTYQKERSPQKKGDQPKEDKRRVKLWKHVLGKDRDVKTIDFPTIDAFVAARRAGRIKVKALTLRKQVSETTIGADIVFLNSVFNWATTKRLPNGRLLLTENPIRGYKRPKTSTPLRPIVSHDRYLKVLEKANEVDPQRLFRSFMVLIDELGWRLSAIRELKGSDVDREAKPHGRIRKRGSVDKEGVEMWVPLSKAARTAIDAVLKVNPVLGDMYLFPMEKDQADGNPWTRGRTRHLLERAEVAAGLKPIEGGDFHPYRRKWATERKHLPDKDVAAAGGWKDLRSLQQCYQGVDDDTLYRVVSEPRKLREKK